MFTLANLRDELKAAQIGLVHSVFRSPVISLGGPTGTLFQVEAAPIVSGTLTLHLQSGASYAPANISALDEEAGVFVTLTAPPSPLYATYTYQEYADGRLEAICRGAIDEIESLWRRGWGWSGSGSASTVFVIDSAGNQVTVPLSSSGDLLDARAEVGLLSLAAQLRYYRALQADASAHAFSYRGAITGLMVDKRSQSASLADLVRSLQQQLTLGVRALQSEYELSGYSGGAFITNPRTVDYRDNFKWRGTVLEDTGT